MSFLDNVLSGLRAASVQLGCEIGARRDIALRTVASSIKEHTEAIVSANKLDVAAALKGGMREALVERLALNEEAVLLMSRAIRAIAELPDPLGVLKSGWRMYNGLFVEERSVPLGVVAIIYESRPNVTAEAFALAYKAGCALLLRPSRAAANSNAAILAAIKAGLEKVNGITEAAAILSGGHEEIDEILRAKGKIDAVIPRGGPELIRHVVENARVPFIETGAGNCHIYVDKKAIFEKALEIIDNAKTQKPGACNAVETVLVHKDILEKFIPLLIERLAGRVELRLDGRALNVPRMNHKGGRAEIKEAQEEDWKSEYLDFILAIKTVDSLTEAISHINQYGTGHSESIITEDIGRADRFIAEVDAACVYTNASTRFTDGGQFGFGAELGISTQKFHARGPMGLNALTTSKYIIRGSGQTRT
ncbi:MAG: glutamate-5-semialdehyde dehydrogenase [Spirochaetaceae bacterium]|jgi:glutamate-5-semialdehyde dehydrogenase|nr:glutamate-5-semialdehyde dehydrogenase [Spirochaetaceae bacterium]